MLMVLRRPLDSTLGAGVGMGDEPGEEGVTPPDRLLQGMHDKVSAHMAFDVPAHDHPGVDVDHEGHIRHAGPRRAVSEIAHPQAVRAGGGEVTFHPVRGSRVGWIRTGREPSPSPRRALDAELAHQPGDTVLVDGDVLAGEHGPDLAAAIHPVVLIEDLQDA